MAHPGHDHGHVHGDVADLFTQETWDARYAESDRLWSGRPNHLGRAPVRVGHARPHGAHPP